MILIGLDIASYKTGWFAMDIENIRFKIGLLEMTGSTEDRIRTLHQKSKHLFKTYQPSMLIIETTYLDEQRKHKFSKQRGNVNTLKILEKCQGSVISASDDLVDIYYMAPKEHKELLTGMGNASKQSTIWTIQKRLGLVDIDDNMADAAALVISHLVKKQQWDILEQFKSKFEK